MSNVAAVLKVMPTSPEVDLESLKQAVENAVPEGQFNGIEEDPIGFGLVALHVTIIVDDGEGGTEPAEAAISALDDVESVEVINVGRLIE